MYDHLPSVEFTTDRAGFVLVDGKRVEVQPGKQLQYRSVELLTCQRCGRRAVPHSLRVVSELDERIRSGIRYFHVPEIGAWAAGSDICSECIERERAA